MLDSQRARGLIELSMTIVEIQRRQRRADGPGHNLDPPLTIKKSERQRGILLIIKAPQFSSGGSPLPQRSEHGARRFIQRRFHK